MTLYGFKLCRFDIAPWQRVCQGRQLQPQGLLLDREEPTAAESLSQWSHPHDTESRSFLRVSHCHKEGFNVASNRPTQETNS
jgi:hypothetical protein